MFFKTKKSNVNITLNFLLYFESCCVKFIALARLSFIKDDTECSVIHIKR